MPSVETSILFMGAAPIPNLTPGPDMLQVTARSVGGGRMAGAVSAPGIALGSL